MFSRSHRSLRLFALFPLTILVVVACGGSAATPTPQPAAATAVPALPSAAGASPAGASPAGSGASQLTDPAAALDGLNSYRFSVTVQGAGMGAPSASAGSGAVSMHGTVVIRPARALSVSMTGMGGAGAAGVTVTYTIVGDKAWMDLGGAAQPLPAGMLGSVEQTFDAFSPQKMFGQTFEQYLGGMKQVGDEQKNGVATLHLRADAQTLEAVAKAVGDTSGAPGDWAMDLWVARDGGYMVSAVTRGTYDVSGTKTSMLVSIDISGVNDPANKVVAPS